jgi:hypothetical protein
LSVTSQFDKLAEKRYVTVLVRLVVDPHGHLIYGQVIDVEGTPQARFTGWRGLGQAVRGWLGFEGEMAEPDEPESGS